LREEVFAMRRTIVGGIVVLILLAAVVPADAEEWKWPSLNPFGSTKKSPSYKVSDSGSGSWLPSWGKSTTARKNTPSTWQKVQKVPTTMMNKTKETLSPLNPFKTTAKKSAPLSPPSPYGNSQPKKDQSNWLTGWMKSEEEKGPPTTVHDWIDAPRPE
jgi:hypothetical protein